MTLWVHCLDRLFHIALNYSPNWPWGQVQLLLHAKFPHTLYDTGTILALLNYLRVGCRLFRQIEIQIFITTVDLFIWLENDNGT